MSHRVTIKPSDHVFTVNEGETVLDAALRSGFIIAYGCRNGACGSCKGKLLEGRLDYGHFQAHALPDAERQAGMALFCQARPLSDLVIRTREVGGVSGIEIRKLPARVQKMERLAPDVMGLQLKLPANDRLQFLAGQYIDVLLPGNVRRSFSMANAPHDDAFIQLYLRNYGGPFSRHVFGKMKERDIVRIEGPFGTFFLREDSEKPIILLASGTGFAPIKAIVEHALHKRLQRPMTLYWGCRAGVDLYLNDLPERWQRDHGLRYIPVLSDAQPADRWSGRTGLVHHAVMEDHPDLSGFQVYACGSPLMVGAAQHDFIGRCGLPEDEFYSDSFTPSVPETGPA